MMSQDHNMHHNHMDHGATSVSDHSQHTGPMMDMGHMMKMYFHFDLGDTVLFQSWTMSSVGLTILMCFGFFFLAFFYEALKCYRECLLKGQYERKCCRQGQEEQQPDEHIISSINGDQISPISPAGNSHRQHVCQQPFVTFGTNNPRSHSLLNRSHVFQSVLHVIQVATSYTLMLGFMTFNCWICFSILLGAGAGYFAFCWRKLLVIDPIEHCH